MKNKKWIGTTIAVLAVLCMAAGCGKKPEEATFSSAAVQEKAPKSVSVTLTKDQVKILTDAKLLSGVQDYIVETGTDVDFAKLISYDKDVFAGVEVDDKKVDYKKTGDYKVAYLLTIDKAALDKAMKGKEKTVSFPEAKDAETILAGYESKVSVMTKEAAEKAAATTGDTKPAVINTATYNETVKHNQESVSNHAQAQSAPIAANASNSGSNQPNKPAQSSQTAQQAKPAQQTKPTQSAQSSNSSQQTKPTQSAQPAQTTKPTQSTQPTQTAKPAQTTQPTKPAQPAQTTQPTQPVQPTQPAKPTQTTQPTQPSKPAQTTQPTQPAQQQTEPQTEAPTEPQTEAPTQPVHEHYWVPVYRTETVDQGFYQEKWEPHQVCRGCGAIVDNWDSDTLAVHISNCPPYSYHAAYVSVGQVWTPVLVDQQVLDHYECSCGETKQP